VWFLFCEPYYLETMKRIKYLIIILTFTAALFSCRKIEELPAIPHIEYTSFSIFDTVDILGNRAKGGRLKFYFEDGDGNLGLKTPDENQTDTTNIFFTLYRKTGGAMVPALPNDPLKPSSYRIPYMERLGQNKILKGTVSVTFFYLFYNTSDTVKYDFFIRDRAQNDSNVASTNEIIIAVNNIY